MTNPPENPPSGIPGSSSWTPQGSAGNPLSFEKPTPPPVVPSTPEPQPGGNAQFELASWGQRFAAWLLDTFLRLGIAYAITAVIFVVFVDHPFSFDTSTFERFTDDNSSDDLSTYGSAINLVWFLIAGFFMHYALAFVYAPTFMALWNGATPGKRALGIRVVRQDGRSVGFGSAFVREPLTKGIVMTIIGGTLFFPWFLNYLWPAWDRECRAWHDMMCSTRVVKG